MFFIRHFCIIYLTLRHFCIIIYEKKGDVNMNYKTFSQLHKEAQEYNDIDMYIAERGWQEWMNEYTLDDELDMTLVSDILNYIYRIAGMSIADLRNELKITQHEMARIYNIPLRTLQRWERDDYAHTKDVYILQLIAYTIFTEKYNCAETLEGNEN